MNIEFAFPWRELHWWLLASALLLAAIAFLLRRLERGRSQRLRRFVDVELAPRLLIGHDARLRRPLFWLVLLGFASMALTFAQPHWGEQWQEVTRRSHDILIVLDVSESMRATDMLPNRLERAKQKIVSILDRSKGDRFGLVAFSGTAELMCPLTLDMGYFRTVLNAVDTDSISMEGTDIGAALEEAVKTFRDFDEETDDYAVDSRAILLISDGEQVAGNAVAVAAEASKYARVFVIGVGDPNGIEVAFSALDGRRGRRISTGETHFSKLDEETLSRIAMEGKGGYITSTPDNADIEQIYELTQQLAARNISGNLRLQLVNRYQIPLAMAIVFFAAEGLWLVLLPWLRDRRERAGYGREEERRYA